MKKLPRPAIAVFALVLGSALPCPHEAHADPGKIAATSPGAKEKKRKAGQRARKSKRPPLPAWAKDLTRASPGPHAELRPVRLSYNLSWKNVVKAGEVDIEVRPAEKQPRVLVGRAEGRSTGLARTLWPYDFEAVSRVDSETLRPLGFTMEEKRRHKRFRYRIEFDGRRAIFHTRQTDTRKPGEAPRTGTRRFRHDFVQDMLSSAIYLRSLPLSQGEKVTLVVTPHNKTYLVSATVLGREKREIRGLSHDTIKLDLGVSKINDDYSLKPYPKLKKATVWISDDAYRLPLDVQAEIFVGFVSARLTEREWLD